MLFVFTSQTRIIFNTPSTCTCRIQNGAKCLKQDEDGNMQQLNRSRDPYKGRLASVARAALKYSTLRCWQQMGVAHGNMVSITTAPSNT